MSKDGDGGCHWKHVLWLSADGAQFEDLGTATGSSITNASMMMLSINNPLGKSILISPTSSELLVYQ
jgi:hypothetical protein